MEGTLARRGTAAGLLLALAGLGLFLARLGQPGEGPDGRVSERILSIPGLRSELAPVDQWSSRFVAYREQGDWAGLDRELTVLKDGARPLYDRYHLDYLQGRAKLESGDGAGALALLAPYQQKERPLLRDLALYHGARAAVLAGDAAQAARLRDTLIAEHPDSLYRPRAVEDQAAALSAAGDATGLLALATRIGNAQPAAIRDAQARAVEVLASTQPDAAIVKGLELLRAGNTDDPADRVATVLDRPEWQARYPPETLVLLGETARNHRHYERAIALLTVALRALPARADDLLFSIGRAHFGAEQFEAAERLYLQGAAGGKDAETRANFLYHAARCAQLRGDDAQGERHLGASIAAAGPSERAAVALTQRIRIRLKNKQLASALTDLRSVQKRFPRSHSVVDAVLAYAVGLVAAGRPHEALRELESIKLRLLARPDGPEINYWRGRALERRSPELATQAYLKVLRASYPTHFAYLARRRVRDEPLAAHVRRRNTTSAARVKRLLAAGDLEAARPLQTDVLLLAPAAEQASELGTLRIIYAGLPAYQAVLALPLPAFPRFPIFSPATTDPAAEPDRHDLLLAMGLFDDAADLIPTRYPLHPLDKGVARAEAMRRAGSSRTSIYAVEVAREEVPDDYVPQLLPQIVRELLYPRYFYDTIAAKSREYGADPRLVLAVMREESRFNPRAKSAAAARGLLQFIITTAREVGRAVGLLKVQPEDLYDPEVVIRLGARYLADLSKEFGGDPYKATAAYNAGPRQATVWARMAAAPGEDFFLTAVTFEETKDYVRKVLNSYYRYAETYGRAEPSGGMRAEP